MKNVAFLVDQGTASLLDPYPASWNALPPTPKGVSVSASDNGWTINISSRSNATFLPWIFGIGFAGIAAFGWIVPSTSPEHLPEFVKYLFTALALIFIPGAILDTWGTDIIQMRHPDLYIRNRFWKWTSTQHLEWEQLTEVRLRHDKGKRNSFARSIELTSNRTIRFGSSLTDEQRAYIAMFLLQKANAETEKVDEPS